MWFSQFYFCVISYLTAGVCFSYTVLLEFHNIVIFILLRNRVSYVNEMKYSTYKFETILTFYSSFF
jgi:hypothetical protein